MNDPGHTYTFGGPAKGWPDFGPDGKVVRDHTADQLHRLFGGADFELCRSPVSPGKACVKSCGQKCEWAGA